MTSRRVAEILAVAALLAGCASYESPPKSQAPILNPSTDLIGRPMPDLSAYEPLGAPLPPMGGRVTVVELGTTDCVGCVKLAPGLEALVKRHPKDAVQLVRVIDGRAQSRESAWQHVQQNHIASPVLYDAEGRLTQRAGAEALPAVFVVDPAGNVLWWDETARVELIDEWVTDALARSR